MSERTDCDYLAHIIEAAKRTSSYTDVVTGKSEGLAPVRLVYLAKRCSISPPKISYQPLA